MRRRCLLTFCRVQPTTLTTFRTGLPYSPAGTPHTAADPHPICHYRHHATPYCSIPLPPARWMPTHGYHRGCRAPAVTHAHCDTMFCRRRDVADHRCADTTLREHHPRIAFAVPVSTGFTCRGGLFPVPITTAADRRRYVC